MVRRCPIWKRISNFFLFLFSLQAFICYYGYFLTKWDPHVIYDAVYGIANGNCSAIIAEYYSMYWNNILITVLFSWIFRIGIALGVAELVNLIYLIIVLGCAVSTLTAYLLFKIMFSYTGSQSAAWCAFAYYVLFLGLSPWLMIPYSDSLGLIFPILIIRLYQTENKNSIRKWFLIGIFSWTGFLLKPYLIFPFFAILLTELATLPGRQEALFPKLKKTALKFCAALSAILLVYLLFQLLIVPQMHFIRDESKTFGFQHYFMMGLNDERDGAYSNHDVVFSKTCGSHCFSCDLVQDGCSAGRDRFRRF